MIFIIIIIIIIVSISQPKTMGDLSTYASSVTRAFQSDVNLGSVVQALCRNSSSTSLSVRHGSDWFFLLVRHLCLEPDASGQPDVMNQVVPFEVSIEEGNSKVAFEHVWDDGGNLVSIALLEAMRTNKTVRSLDLFVDYLEEPHLAAILDSLLENDTLQSLSICVACGIACPIDDVRAIFLRILKRNMCLRDLDIRCVRAVAEDSDAEDELMYSRDPDKKVDLGTTVTEAVGRNRQAFAVAKALGRVSRNSMIWYPNLGDIAFRHRLLLFFLQKGCQPPPMMLYIAEGLPKH